LDYVQEEKEKRKEQSNQIYLEDTNKTEQQASPQLPEVYVL
jgi:hypothetical protein